MGLISAILTAPLAPVKGVVWVAEQVHDQAMRELYDPDVDPARRWTRSSSTASSGGSTTRRPTGARTSSSSG